MEVILEFSTTVYFFFINFLDYQKLKSQVPKGVTYTQHYMTIIKKSIRQQLKYKNMIELYVNQSSQVYIFCVRDTSF